MRRLLLTAAALAATAALGAAGADAAQKLKQVHVLGGGVSGPSAAGGFASNTGGLPTFSQVNGTKSKAVTEHASCGADCWTHDLVSHSGNLDLTVKMGFACPAGDYVEQIYYDYVPGVGLEFAYQYDGGFKQQQKVATIVLQPWSAVDFESAANQALGGTWGDDEYPAPQQHGTIDMTRSIRVFANCGNDDTTKYKDFVIRTRLSATDKDFAAPAQVQTSMKKN